MDLGFIGLGRMGANMVRRLLLDNHHIVAYNRTAEKTREIMTEGADGAFSLEELVGKLAKPRAVWVMVPSGDATESMIDELLKLLEPGDTIVDGGNSNFHDSVRRHAKVAEHGVNFIDAGDVGRHLGPQGRLLPDGRRRARAGEAPRADLPLARARGRLPPRRRPRRGPLRQDDPQRHRVRHDAGLRRGLRDPPRQRLQARPGRHRRSVDARLGRAIVAARAGGLGLLAGPGPRPT